MTIVPEKLEDFVGNEKELKQLRECIVKNRPVLLYGTAGVGKTSSVHIIAEELGLKVTEINASDERKKDDLQNLLKLIKIKGLYPFLILVDECDGLPNSKILEDLASGSRHPIVFVANEVMKVPEAIKKRCVKIELHSLGVRDVVGYLKEVEEKTKGRFDYSNVSGDMRSSLNTVRYGGEGYSEEIIFEEINDYFRGKDIELDRDKMVWLMDNCEEFFRGRELWEFIRILAQADKIGKLELMNLLSRDKIGRTSFPYFFRRVNVLRKSSDKND